MIGIGGLEERLVNSGPSFENVITTADARGADVWMDRELRTSAVDEILVTGPAWDTSLP